VDASSELAERQKSFFSIAIGLKFDGGVEFKFSRKA